MMKQPKSHLKQALGELPWTAELIWKLRYQGRPLNRKYSLQATQKHAAEWLAQAQEARSIAPPGKKLSAFESLARNISD